ncbi:MAG: YodL domain-containing protein [Eubacteriales bacterium]|nr:YodL domain-containing protein [Eubacteriales bacterium]
MNKIRKWDDVHGVAEPEKDITAFLESTTDSYAILQLRDTDEAVFDRFMSMDYLKQQGREPEIDHYEVVCTASLLSYKDVNTMLEEIYVKFNMDRPPDFTGHSLSVSDIVALKQNGVISCHYVDSIGFRELPNFLKPENYLKYAEMSMEDDYGMIDGVINNGRKEEEPEKTSVLEQLQEKREDPPCVRCPKKSDERGIE